MRLHFGGKWEEVAPINTVQVFNWIGGMHVNIEALVLRNYTMQSISDLVTKYYPNTSSHGLIFYYMIGGIRFDLNSDTEVQFLWNNIPPSLDDYTNIYCESTLESNDIGTQASTIITTDSPTKNTRSKTKLSSVPLNESQTYTLANLSTPKKTTINVTLHDSPASNTRSAVKRLLISSPCKCV